MSGTIENRCYFEVPFENLSSEKQIEVTINRPVNRMSLLSAVILKLDQNVDETNNEIEIYINGVNTITKTLDTGLYSASEFVTQFNSKLQGITINGTPTNFTLSIDNNTFKSSVTMSQVHTEPISIACKFFINLGFASVVGFGFIPFDAGAVLSKSETQVNFNNELLCHVLCNFCINRCSSEYTQVLDTILMSEENSYTYSEFSNLEIENNTRYLTQVLIPGSYNMIFSLRDENFKPITCKDSYLVVLMFFRDENRGRNIYELMELETNLFKELLEIFSDQTEHHVEHDNEAEMLRNEDEIKNMEYELMERELEMKPHKKKDVNFSFLKK